MAQSLSKEHWNRVFNNSSRHPWSGVPSWLGDVINKYDPTPRAALDLGTGTGDKAVWLAERKFKVTGIDISEIAIAKAEQAAEHLDNSPLFMTADLGNLPQLKLRRRQFGLILDLLSIQFLPAAKQQVALQEVSKLLSTQGIMIHSRVSAQGSQSPEWVQQRTLSGKSLTELLSPFEQVEKFEQPSTNLPDTITTTYILK